MTPRQYLEAILDGVQCFSFKFSKVIIFKGNSQIAFFDKGNTDNRDAETIFFMDTRHRVFGDSIKMFFFCLKDIQKYGLLLNYDESDYISLHPSRWLKVVDFPQIVIMNCVENGYIDSISLIADDETMFTLQIRCGEYDILAVDLMFDDAMIK